MSKTVTSSFGEKEGLDELLYSRLKVKDGWWRGDRCRVRVSLCISVGSLLGNDCQDNPCPTVTPHVCGPGFHASRTLIQCEAKRKVMA